MQAVGVGGGANAVMMMMMWVGYSPAIWCTTLAVGYGAPVSFSVSLLLSSCAYCHNKPSQLYRSIVLRCVFPSSYILDTLLPPTYLHFLNYGMNSLAADGFFPPPTNASPPG
jgi:hypothetical protein